ncbi:hypothetical protein WA158_002929 [Blastocystis sp. Blastoise]
MDMENNREPSDAYYESLTNSLYTSLESHCLSLNKKLIDNLAVIDKFYSDSRSTPNEFRFGLIYNVVNGGNQATFYTESTPPQITSMSYTPIDGYGFPRGVYSFLISYKQQNNKPCFSEVKVQMKQVLSLNNLVYLQGVGIVDDLEVRSFALFDLSKQLLTFDVLVEKPK